MAEAKQKVTETEIKKAKAVLAAIGNEQEIDIKQSKIQDVTLFLSGAEITRSLKVNLEEGTNKIYINGFVKDQIIAQSISAEFLDGQDSARIYAVDYKTALVLDREASSTSKEVREKSQNAADELLKLEQELKVLEGEEKLLSSTNSTELKIADIKELSKFFNTRMTEIASIRLKIVKRQRELNDLVKTLEYQTKRSIDTTLVYQGQIGIEVYSAKKQTVNLKLVYSISGNKGASWQPIYNLKVNQTDQKTTSKLALRAVIKQETNEDWSDVKLTLSSSQLTLGVKEPTLKPWYMYAYDASSPRRMMKEKASFSMEKFSVKREEVDYEFFDSAPEERVRSNSVEANVQRETAVNENALSVSYQLYGEQTIISGIQKTIDVTEQDITATFNYYAVPKLNTSVYYMMHIENFAQLNLLTGEINILYNDKFIGTSRLDLNNIDQALQVSLGKENNIVVKYEPGKENRKKGIFGSGNKETRAFTISVHNLKKQKVNLCILDQLPVSCDKVLTVEALEISGAIHNSQTGQLKWEFELNENGKKEINIKYTLSYPSSHYIH